MISSLTAGFLILDSSSMELPNLNCIVRLATEIPQGTKGLQKSVLQADELLQGFEGV